MSASLEIYDTTLTTVLDSNVFVGDIQNSQTPSVASCKVKNDGDALATYVRVFARCLNGLYSGQDNELGQEAITEKWIEARVAAGAWTPIGGDFAGGTTPSPAANYVALADIAAGASSDQIDFRLNLPSSITSAGGIIIQVGVSHGG